MLSIMGSLPTMVKEMTGVEVPTYYNPNAINPLKYAEGVRSPYLPKIISSQQKYEPFSGQEEANAVGCKRAEASRPDDGGLVIDIVVGSAELHSRDVGDGEGGGEGLWQRPPAGRGHHAEAEGALQLAVQAELQQMGEHQLWGQQHQREIQAGIAVAKRPICGTFNFGFMSCS